MVNAVPAGSGAEMIQSGSALDKGRAAREQVENVDLGVAGDALNTVKDKAEDVKLLADAVMTGPPADYMLAIDGSQREPVPVDAPTSIDATRA